MEVVQDTERSRFVVRTTEGEAFVQYEMRNQGTIELYHTEVPEILEGRGIGSVLARGSLDHARRNGLRVVASCPFIKGWLQKHHEYDDLQEQ